jgi:hypothetical protein
VPSPIRSPLKTTGRPGFAHTIFPGSHEAFDLLCVGGFWTPTESRLTVPAASDSMQGTPIKVRDRGIYLNSALDLAGSGRLPIGAGAWQLRYEFYAISFPLLSVSIAINVTNWDAPNASIISQETN